MAGSDREFTTWITGKVAPTSEAEARKLERIYDRTFDHIRQRAAAASRATAGLVGGGGSAGRTMGTQVQETNRLSSASDRLARASAATTVRMRQQAQAAAHLDQRNQALVQGLRSTSTALQVVQGPLGPMAGRITALSNALERLTGFRLGLAAVGAGLFALTLAANRAADIRNKLSPLYQTQEQVNDAFRRTVQIARDTKTALEPIVDLYSRLTLAGRGVGLGDMAIERTTRSAALGARLSGGSREAQQAALTQLAQGIGSNRLGGEELKSILEQAPRIAQAIADGLSNTEHFGQVTIGMLRQLGADGELTAQRVAGALGRSLRQLEEEAKRLGPTLSSSMSAFGTEFTANISRLDQAIGLTRSFATVIQFAADNMREIVALTVGLAVAWGTVKILPKLEERAARFRTFMGEQSRAYTMAREAALSEQRSAVQNYQALTRYNEGLKVKQERLAATTRAAEAEFAATRRTADNLAVQAQPGMGGVVGASGAQRRYAEAAAAAERAERRLIAIRRQSNATADAVAAAETRLAQATTRMEAAKRRATSVSSRFRFVLGSLISAINPLGIIIGIATAAIIEWAMAESQAERNARRLEEIQRQLADTVDETTGRIREQNAEIRRGLLLRSNEARGLARGQYASAALGAISQARGALQIGERYATFQEAPFVERQPRPRRPIYLGGVAGTAAQRILDAAAAGQMNPGEASRQMNALAAANPNIPELRRAADLLAHQLPDIQTRGRAVLLEESRARELQGQGTEEDRRRLRGDWSGGRVEGLTPAQIRAQATTEAQRMRDPRYRAARTRNRALEALGRERDVTADDRVQREAEILAQYDQEIEQIQRAEQAENRRGEAAQRRQERLAEQARDRAQTLQNLMSQFEDDAPVRQLERVYDAAERAKGAIHDMIGEQVDGIGRFTPQMAQERIAQIDASTRRQGARFLTDTMDRFTDETPIRRMRQLATEARNAKRDIDALVGRSLEGYEQGFSQADAERLKASIDAYVETERRRPITDMLRQSTQQMQVQALILQGREQEAAVLERAYQLAEQMNGLSREDLRLLAENEAAQRRINDALAERQRVVETLTAAAEDARQTIQGTLEQLGRGRPDRALATFFRGMLNSAFQVQTRLWTNRIMEGTDRRIQDLVNGRVRVDTAVGQITSGMTTAGTAALDFAARLQTAAVAVEAAAANMRPGPGAAAVITPRPAPTATDRIEIKNPLANMIVGGDSFAQHVARGSSGVDLRARVGTQVTAPFDGTLTMNHSQRGGMQAFVTSLDGRMRAGFAHLSQLQVEGFRQGMQVVAGQLIALTGNSGINPRTGRNVDPHLHSSLRIDGRSVDPMQYFGRTIQQSARAGAAQVVREAGGRQDGGAFDFGAHPPGQTPTLAEIQRNSAAVTQQLATAANAGITPGAQREQMTALQGVIGDLYQAVAGPQGMTDSQRRAAQVVHDLDDTMDVDWRNIPRGDFAPDERDQPKVQNNLGVRELYNRLGRDIGGNLDKLLGTNFAAKIGGSLGDVLVGAGKGQMASGVARMIGIKQSNTGAAIGGAIGQLAAPFLGPLAPFAPFIGGFLGGTIGGLFKKTPKGSTTVSLGQFGDFVNGNTSGSSKQLRAAAEELGGSVGQGLQQIADALYGTLTGSGSVSIGKRKEKFVVDPSGTGRTKGGGVLKFDTEQEAVEAAIKIMIQKGVIGGISAASQKILQSGKDLQTAITKAAAIESIPRRLMQIQDPVRYAITELNREFSDLINYLKEGGATAEQFAQAQQLYNISREQAVAQARQQAAGQIQNFLDEMIAGSSSPLNRRTVYANAQEQLNRFVADIGAGKRVDEGELLEAARNFQAASEGLNGRGEAFFTDFRWLYDLLAKARDNAISGVDTTTPLPGSPFETDPTLQNILNGTTTAITDQTGILNGTLTDILTWLQTNGLGGGGVPSSIDLLPGGAGGGGGTGGLGGKTMAHV